MKVLYHHRTQAEDGQAAHVRQMIRAFEEVGHEVSEVGLVRHGAATQAQAGDPPAGGESAGKPDAPAASEAAGGARSGRNRWGWVTRLPRFARELAEYGYSGVAKNHILREAAWFEPDFLYERYAFGNVAGVLAANKLGKPLVLEVNAPLVDELEATRGVSWPGIARRLERFVFSGAQVVCVVSEVLRERMLELGAPPERTVVTPNGVRLEDFACEDADEARRSARRALGLPAQGELGCCIGFVGYYRDWHRLDLVLEALRAPSLADAHLALVGEGPAEADLRERVLRAGLEARVHFCGPRQGAQIPSLLRAFDIGVVPAINAYASPLKLHEYMAAALPVVAPDQPNLREVLTQGEQGWLVAPGEVDALAQALGKLAADAELRARMGRAGHSTLVKRKLTWRDNVWRVVDAVAPHLTGVSHAEGRRSGEEQGVDAG